MIFFSISDCLGKFFFGGELNFIVLFQYSNNLCLLLRKFSLQGQGQGQWPVNGLQM